MSTARHPPPAVAAPAVRAAPSTQLVRFAVVGASNTAVTFIAYILLALVVPAAAAAALGWAAGAVNGYRWNRGWTFATSRRGLRPAGRYAAVQAIAAGCAAAAVAVVAPLSSHLDAELVALPLTSLLAFVACRAWVFA